MQKRKMIFLSLLVTFTCISFAMKPPAVEKKRKIMVKHGDIRIDHYFWLREKKNPEVIDYLKAENRYTDHVMKGTEKLQEKLYQEMVCRIKEDDVSVPIKQGEYYYYVRTEKGKQYSIYCRKKGSLDAQEEIYLDVNKEADGKDYFSMSRAEVSPDNRYLAYGADLTGSEKYTVFIKDLETGKMLADRLEQTSYSLVWTNDSKALFYCTRDEANRPSKAYIHKLGTDQKDDKFLFEEKDATFWLSVGKTRDKEIVYLSSVSRESCEYRIIPGDKPFTKPVVFQERIKDVEYYISHRQGVFYILTNHKAETFRLMTAKTGKTGIKNWKEMIPYRPEVTLDDIDLFRNYLVLNERRDGLPWLRVIGLNSDEDYMIEFPESVYTFWGSQNKNFETDLIRFNYSSLTSPQSVYEYDMKERKLILRKVHEVKGYLKPLYHTERIFAKASDGTEVPIDLMYRKGLKLDGSSPCYLYGYGSYGSTMDPYFASTRLSVIDRGFVYARALVRGGGDMGRKWYDNGKLMKKMNTFTDFITCAEYLIKKGYTCKEKLFISGGSAGGLLMGAVTNMRPDLFKGVVADVPFVDALNTMLDPTIPLTVNEYAEWGNPEEKEAYYCIKEYSPYDNVSEQDYPNMLVTAGLNDPRVQYWEPAKWVAKLRQHKTDSNVLILKTNMGQGHMGASGRYDYLKEIAFEWAFLLKVLREE